VPVIEIQSSWSEQFHLSISNENGYIETIPVRTYNDGKKQFMGDSIRCENNTKELMYHLMQFEYGDLNIWQKHFFDDWDEEDVCRNGKPIKECECC